MAADDQSAGEPVVVAAEALEVVADRERLRRRWRSRPARTVAREQRCDAVAGEVVDVGRDHRPPAAPHRPRQAAARVGQRERQHAAGRAGRRERGRAPRPARAGARSRRPSRRRRSCRAEAGGLDQSSVRTSRPRRSRAKLEANSLGSTPSRLPAALPRLGEQEADPAAEVEQASRRRLRARFARERAAPSPAGPPPPRRSRSDSASRVGLGELRLGRAFARAACDRSARSGRCRRARCRSWSVVGISPAAERRASSASGAAARRCGTSASAPQTRQRESAPMAAEANEPTALPLGAGVHRRPWALRSSGRQMDDPAKTSPFEDDSVETRRLQARTLELLSVVAPLLQRGGDARRSSTGGSSAALATGSSSSWCSSTTARPTDRRAARRARRAATAAFGSSRLSRNFGHQAALTAGLDHARGDAVVMIDADLQDPPEVIAEMLDALAATAPTSSTRSARSAPARRGSSSSTARWFYRLFARCRAARPASRRRRLPAARPPRARRARTRCASAAASSAG